VADCFQREEDRILVAPEVVVVEAEEARFGGAEDQPCSVAVGDGRVVPVG